MPDNSQICTKFDKCPIYKGGVLVRPESEMVYKKLFCNAGEKKYITCKRYIIAEMTGKSAPNTIMPNSFLSVMEIIDKMKSDN
jgi:hypothetical protein